MSDLKSPFIPERNMSFPMALIISEIKNSDNTSARPFFKASGRDDIISPKITLEA